MSTGFLILIGSGFNSLQVIQVPAGSLSRLKGEGFQFLIGNLGTRAHGTFTIFLFYHINMVFNNKTHQALILPNYFFYRSPMIFARLQVDRYRFKYLYLYYLTYIRKILQYIAKEHTMWYALTNYYAFTALLPQYHSGSLIVYCCRSF